MLVLAAVPTEMVARLQQAARHRFTFAEAATWDDAVAAILRRPLEMAVLDPGLSSQPRAQEIERIRVLFPSLPLILYTRMMPNIAPVLLRLGRAQIRRVVIAGYDDHPTQLGDALAEEAAHAVSQRLIGWIDKTLGTYPGELRWAIETMIREPASVQSVQQLADRARMDRRTCLRWFARAQLPPPSVMLMVLRVVYAHSLLQDPGYTVEDVAEKLGYAQTRTFAQNVKEVLGRTPGELRVSFTLDDSLEVVRKRYFARAVDKLAHAS